MSELEHGRYRLTEVVEGGSIQMPDGRAVHVPPGGGLLSRAIDICDTCGHCGCGTTAEPVVLPSAVIKVLTGKQIEMHEIMGLAAALPGGFMKGLTGGRTAKQGSGDGAEAPKGRRAARRARRSPGGVGLPDQTADSPADPASTPVAG